VSPVVEDHRRRGVRGSSAPQCAGSCGRKCLMRPSSSAKWPRWFRRGTASPSPRGLSESRKGHDTALFINSQAGRSSSLTSLTDPRRRDPGGPTGRSRLSGARSNAAGPFVPFIGVATASVILGVRRSPAPVRSRPDADSHRDDRPFAERSMPSYQLAVASTRSRRGSDEVGVVVASCADIAHCVELRPRPADPGSVRAISATAAYRCVILMEKRGRTDRDYAARRREAGPAQARRDPYLNGRRRCRLRRCGVAIAGRHEPLFQHPGPRSCTSCCRSEPIVLRRKPAPVTSPCLELPCNRPDPAGGAWRPPPARPLGLLRP